MRTGKALSVLSWADRFPVVEVAAHEAGGYVFVLPSSSLELRATDLWSTNSRESRLAGHVVFAM